MLTPQQLSEIRKKDLPLFNLLKEMIESVNRMGLSAGIDPKPAPQTEITKAIPAPKQPASINVKATADTIFVILTAGVGNAPGAIYFVERATEPSFKEVVSYSLGNSLQLSVPLEAGVYYWRAYARYPHSGKSPYSVFEGGAVTASQSSSSLFQGTQSKSVASTTETSLIGVGTGSKDVQPGTLSDGTSIRVRASGILQIQPGSPQLQVDLKLGSTVLLSTGLVTL